ncbi:LPS assembly lipoprotein LptE [uncultured Thalassolituus sp.]|uniref:LPS-assembly lipoprotein LptE n=1 Tax=uncultured Thalassolituus sp. TaxID=285273 RepID=UPI0026249592|nr:LPS assembly lipoprotein LptE [uncultured Thalassolituus sp.]
MRHLITALTLTLIASCGWQLRGVSELPEGFRIIHVGGGPQNIREQLIQRLRFNDVVVPERALDAPAQIEINEYSVERRTLSVNSVGQIAEYEFNALLDVTVTRGEETHHFVTEARRTLSNDVNNVVATQQEERQLRDALDSDLLSRLMRRLERL